MELDCLCSYIGVSGYEDNITKEVTGTVNKDGYDKSEDAIGNILYQPSNSSKQKVLITAHIDEVGIQITKVIDNVAEFKAIGNVKCDSLINQRIVFENGAIGIVFAKGLEAVGKYEYSSLYLEIINLSVEIGDVGTFVPNYYGSADYITGKSLDNRSGCYILYYLMDNLTESKFDISFGFTVQEEIGLKGYKVLLARVKPDIVINIDVSPVGPCNNIEMGAGVAIKLSDSVGVSNRALVKEFKKLASDNNIDYQLEVSDCGTSELALVSEVGIPVKNIGLSIPAKGVHTANTIIKCSDIKATIQLLEEFIKMKKL